MKNRKLWTFALLVVALVWLWSHVTHRQAPSLRTDEAGKPLLLDRVWIDQMPQQPTDKIHLFVAITERPLGAFEHRSVWEGTWEVFRWRMRREDQRFLVELPQTGDKAEIEWDAQACREGGFDYCLTLKGSPRGPERYYSKKGWEIRSRAEAEALVDGLLSATE